MLIIKIFIVLTSVARLTNIFMLCVNNTGGWLKIFSKIYIVHPQIKYLVLEAKILFSIPPGHFASSLCSIHVIDQLKAEE